MAHCSLSHPVSRFLLTRPGFKFVGTGKHRAGARVRGLRHAKSKGAPKNSVTKINILIEY